MPAGKEVTPGERGFPRLGGPCETFRVQHCDQRPVK
jgi:hypothetical protein